jgi:hypothetical protein
MHTTLEHRDSGDSITTTVVNDGPKNTIFLISGSITSELDSVFDIIDCQSLSNHPKSMKIDSIVFVVESGLKVFIEYRDQPYIIPLEGRSKIELEALGGIVGHEIDLICRGTGAFFLVLDISKMGV